MNKKFHKFHIQENRLKGPTSKQPRSSEAHSDINLDYLIRDWSNIFHRAVLMLGLQAHSRPTVPKFPKDSFIPVPSDAFP